MHNFSKCNLKRSETPGNVLPVYGFTNEKDKNNISGIVEFSFLYLYSSLLVIAILSPTCERKG